MSYILDALRRADAERDRGAVPSVHTQSPFAGGAGPSTDGVARKPPWLWLGAGASAIAVIAAAAWALRGTPAAQDGPIVAAAAPATAPSMTTTAAPQTTATPSNATSRAPAMPTTLPVPATPPTSGIAPPDTAPAQTAQRPSLAAAVRARLDEVPPVAPTALSAQGDRAGTAASRRPPTPAAAHPTVAATRADAAVNRADASFAAAATVGGDAAPPPATATAPAVGDRIYTVQELPDDLQRELPKLAVGGSMYSPTPASRLLIVNGQVLHEGDTLPPGLVLRQIRLKSAVFSYRDRRFEIRY